MLSLCSREGMVLSTDGCGGPRCHPDSLEQCGRQVWGCRWMFGPPRARAEFIMRERRILAAREGVNPSPFKCQSLSSLSQEPPACWGSRRTSKLLHPCLGCLLQQRTAWQRWMSK